MIFVRLLFTDVNSHFYTSKDAMFLPLINSAEAKVEDTHDFDSRIEHHYAPLTRVSDDSKIYGVKLIGM